MSPAGAAVEPASLTRHGAKVGSVFSLLGRNENDLTAALGFAMARCRPFAAAVLDRVWPTHTAGEAAHFALEVRAEVGHTDLEVKLPASSALVIFEAKRGWLLPTKQQLAQYVSRIHHDGAGALVSLSQASPALAATQLPWGDILSDIAATRPAARGHERLWLDELHT